MRRRAYLPRTSGRKVAEHVVEAFRARLEVALNAINYLTEEKRKCRNFQASGEVELYVRGYVRRRVVGRMHRQQAVQAEREAALGLHLSKTHAEKTWDEASSTVVMWCGAVANLLDDGTTDPPEVDFYIEPWGSRADCPRCLSARRKALR